MGGDLMPSGNLCSVGPSGKGALLCLLPTGEPLDLDTSDVSPTHLEWE